MYPLSIEPTLQGFRLCSSEWKDYQNELYPTIITISPDAFPLSIPY